MNKIKNLVVGCGLTGIVIAERISKCLKQPVTIIDARSHIGGNCYDYRDANGICIHKYGPHIFHTSNTEVWQYLSNFTEWQFFFLKVKAYIEGKEVPFSFNLNSIKESFPTEMSSKIISKLIEKFGYGKRISIIELRKIIDPDLKFLADYIYQNAFLNYYKKQWGGKPEDLDPTIAERVPISISVNNNYFIDKYQGIPLQGYTEMFKKMLNNPLITVKLNCKYDKKLHQAENVFYTGPIDEYFNYELGELPYRSLRFDIKEINQEFYQDNVVISYPNNYDFTRICEHKYFLNDKSKKTVVSLEYPEKFKRGVNERYYPVPQKENFDLYTKYMSKAQHLKNVFFLGRLGAYQYYNMDKAIEKALAFIKGEYHV